MLTSVSASPSRLPAARCRASARSKASRAEPYLVLTVALSASYTAALLWHRWRG
jgi:hypothetical protein